MTIRGQSGLHGISGSWQKKGEYNMNPSTQHTAKQAVVNAGEGRGFIIEISERSVRKQVVVTAAHCLPGLPPAHSCAYNSEKTYMNFLGPLGEASPSISAECLFVDPIADIALLGEPDEPALGEAFEEFLGNLETLRIVDLLTTPETAWLLSLEGHWLRCLVDVMDQVLWISDGYEGSKGGMSGSPIILDDGRVLGVLSNSLEGEGSGPVGPQPRLPHCLPLWASDLCDDTERR